MNHEPTANNDRYGDWLQTYTGVVFWPLDPRPEEILIEDIARSLSMQCRYAGHVKRFYSVAEHSVHVSYAVPPADMLWGLLHDATEAYLIDIPRPIKNMLPEYRIWEARMMDAIALRFGLLGRMPESVKEIDNRMLTTERAVLHHPCDRDWGETGPALPGVHIHGWMPNVAYEAFMDRFHQLQGAL